MIRFLSSILFCIFLSFDLIAQTGDTILAFKGEIKNFLNNIKKQEIRDGLIWLCNQPYALTEKEIAHYAASANIILSGHDEELIRIQIEKVKNIQWDKSLIDSAVFISQDSISAVFKIKDKEAAWDFFSKKYCRRFYKISLPIFIKDKEYCVIQIDYFCGTLCGTSLVNIYKWEGNEWRLYLNVDYSVS